MSNLHRQFTFGAFYALLVVVVGVVVANGDAVCLLVGLGAHDVGAEERRVELKFLVEKGVTRFLRDK